MAGRLLKYARQDLAPLHRNPAHVFAAEHALVAYGSGAVYSFIPKNACSTLRVSLALANGCIAGPQDWPWIHHNNMTFRADLRDLARAPFTFVVLRCPHARLASVFLDKIVGLRPEAWALHRAAWEGFDPRALTFRQFVTLLEDPELFELDIHWQPQVAFLVYEDYDLWVPMEDFAAHAAAIEAGAGLALVDARGLTGHGTDGLIQLGGDFSDTPVHEIATLRRAGQGPAHTALYDAGLADRVARLYADDGDLYQERFGPEGLLFPKAFKRTDRGT